MSFSGTPLGQGRRLDHRTFLNKPNPAARVTLPLVSSRPPNSPPRPAEPSVPTSYSYGAPTQATRSPPKPISASSSRDSHPEPPHLDAESSQELPALARFARLKERETATTTGPDPIKWSVKDTSVQIANAFQIAAESSSEMAHYNNSNDSWSSAANRSQVPRSSSVEYEKETQSTRHLPIKPPSRTGPPPPARSTGASRQQLSKAKSLQYVPASDDEEENPVQRERGKSPLLDTVADFARRTAFYLRAPSQEPQAGPSEELNGHTNGHNRDTSYDYAAEEAEYEKSKTSQGKAVPRKSAAHRRGQMSEDAKAYRPNPQELDDDDDDESDDGRPRRRKKKKGKKDATGGPLNTLPVTTYEKRRRRRRSKGGPGEEVDEDEDEEPESGSEKVGEQLQSVQRLSLPPPPVRKPSLRGSVPPEPQFEFPNESIDEVLQAGLPSVEEEAEETEEPETHPPRIKTRSASAYSFGGLLGKVVNLFLRVVMLSLTTFAHYIGRATGIAYDVFFFRPARFLATANLGPLFRIFVVGVVLFGVFTALRNVDFPSFLPIGRQAPVYHAPDIPASSIAEIAARLQAAENALAGLALDTQQSRVKIESSARIQHDVSVRLDELQAKLKKEADRAADDRVFDRSAASKGLTGMRSEIELLREQISALLVPSKDDKQAESAHDEQVRAWVAALEGRIGGIEVDVREALEMGKHAVKVPSTGNAPAWWTKISSSGKALTIKSSDGQDITDVIGHLVETAVSRHTKDVIAKADYALYSGGARAIPSRTSPTLDLVPDGILGKIAGFATRGSGFAIGRPPVTAIHHETHLGHCWPFPGNDGHLGVKLSRSVLVSEITIDHIPTELALDMTSAPRKMEVWGYVEGAENTARVHAWEEERARRHADGEDLGEELDDGPYPDFFPPGEKHIRIARFEYDINSSQAVQTFVADPDIRALGVDFGLVTLRVLSNWGQYYTCIYRLRVHGEQQTPDRHEPIIS